MSMYLLLCSGVCIYIYTHTYYTSRIYAYLCAFDTSVCTCSQHHAYMHVYVSIYLSVYVTISLSTYLPIYPSVYPSIYLCNYRAIHVISTYL